MTEIFKPIKKKLAHTVNTLMITGIVLLLLGVMVVWTDLMLRLVMGMVIIALAYTFLYLAWRLENIKKHVEKYLKF